MKEATSVKLSTQTIATASARHRAASSSRSSSSGSERSCSARIITGAALIIVAMFAGFARDDLIMFQQMASASR